VAAPQAAPAANTPAMVLKPAELNGLIAKGERFLQSGDLASARLFFGRAAKAGDPRGARGLAQTYDPEVVRKLPVYGLPVDQAEADAWYARARELESGKALAQQ
jgi:TPR repeat protein